MAVSEESGDNMMEGGTATNENNTKSLLTVVLSLVFVIIFGCALIGGLVSGDPTNGFFITIIVASALAIAVAVGVAIRYFYVNRISNDNNDIPLSKTNGGTFSSSDEENQCEEEYIKESSRNEVHEYGFPDQPQIESEIKVIQARSVVGEMSALSPSSYGEESLSTFRHHIIKNNYNSGRRGLDFSRITADEQGEKVRMRRDPPEGVGGETIEEILQGASQDPDGEHLLDDKSTISAKSGRSKKSSTSTKKNSNDKKLKKFNPPSSTKSGSAVPPTPAASEAGSFAGSIMSMFGKSKKASSEVGVESTKKSSTNKVNGGKPPMVRPPMIPSSNRNGEDTTKTIDNRIGQIPSTPGNKSTFTIPPPRPVPRTPMGSGFYAESTVAGSVAASSTFDPQAHQMALEKMRMNEASIGANPVDTNAMTTYYDDNEGDDDNNDKDSSIAPGSVVESSALSYDVFAPPGALGIIVDTTEKGCIIHSMKKSSPMRGLMNRGDIIIGLDNFDVRNMSAASLSKLMAKKSDQAERKFTLLPSNS